MTPRVECASENSKFKIQNSTAVTMPIMQSASGNSKFQIPNSKTGTFSARVAAARVFVLIPCWKCGGQGRESGSRVVKIPAEELQEETRFTCRFCNRQGYVPTNDRRVSINSVRASLNMERRAWNAYAARERHLGEPNGVNFSGLSSKGILKSLSTVFIERVLKHRSRYIAKARRDYDPWVLAATINNLVRLPRRALAALLLVAFLDFSTRRAASELEVTEFTIYSQVRDAKRYLVEMAEGRWHGKPGCALSGKIN